MYPETEMTAQLSNSLCVFTAFPNSQNYVHFRENGSVGWKKAHYLHFNCFNFRHIHIMSKEEVQPFLHATIVSLAPLTPIWSVSPAHYCCPLNDRLQIASRTKSLPLSDPTAFLSKTHSLLLLLVKMNSPRQLKVWTITSAVRKVRPNALQPEGEHQHISICHLRP